MKQSKNKSPQGSVSDQADYWLTVIKSPLADQQQQQEFKQWLAEKAENQEAYTKAQLFWQKLDGLNTGQIAQLEQRLIPKAIVSKKPNISVSLFQQVNSWSIPVAACLLLFVIIGFNQIPAYFADYRTGTGEQKTIQLSDGSTIILNTETAVSDDYTKYGRILTLYSGEAYFKVAPDTNRPFEVMTDKGQVRALGTAFDVKAIGDNMVVTVHQHAVRVKFKQNPVIDVLNEGERVVFANKQVSAIEIADLKQAQNWRKQRLVFTEQPLKKVIAELNRYRPGEIFIINTELADHLVTGVFDPRDTETALSAIENTLNLKQYRLTDRLVFLVEK